MIPALTNNRINENFDFKATMNVAWLALEGLKRISGRLVLSLFRCRLKRWIYGKKVVDFIHSLQVLAPMVKVQLLARVDMTQRLLWSNRTDTVPELGAKKLYATTALTEPPLRLPKMAYLLMTSRLFFWEIRSLLNWVFMGTRPLKFKCYRAGFESDIKLDP